MPKKKELYTQCQTAVVAGYDFASVVHSSFGCIEIDNHTPCFTLIVASEGGSDLPLCTSVILFVYPVFKETVCEK